MSESEPPRFATTAYFRHTRRRPDRQAILDAWVVETIETPEFEAVQSDGRLRRWRYIPDHQRYLRVVLLADGRTVHNAFFDRRFRP